MKRKLVLFIFILGLPVISTAQTQFFEVGDTIQHRMLIAELPDSTLFSYEIGELRIISGSGFRFLHFRDSTGNVEDQYLKSESFTIGSSTDTFRCSRFAFFDSRQMPHDTDTYLTEQESDSAADAIHVLYSSTEFTPTSTTFSSSSVVRYILELRATSDNRVLARIDTLRCYLNPDGYLRYRTPGRTLNFVRHALPNMVDSAVYFAVRTEAILPGSTLFTFTGRETAKQRELLQNRLFAPIQQDIPLAAPKKGGQVPQSSARQKNLAITEAYPTLVRQNFVLGFIADAPGEAQVQIQTTSGNVAKWYRITVNPGFNRLGFNFADLPSGGYLLLLTADNEAFSRKFQIIH